MEWNGKKNTNSLHPGETLKIQKPAALENEKLSSKNTKSTLKKEKGVESSRPVLKFPLKNRPPYKIILQNSASLLTKEFYSNLPDTIKFARLLREKYWSWTRWKDTKNTS